MYYYGHGDDAAGSSTFVGLASVSPRRDDASADQEAPEQEFFADPGGAIQPEQSRGSSTSAQV